MTAGTSETAPRIRLALAVLLILVTGFWGLVITFSDSPAGWSLSTVAAYVAAWHVPSALVVGLLVPRQWWLGITTVWGALLMLVFTQPLIALLLVLVTGGAAYAGGFVARRLFAAQRSTRG